MANDMMQEILRRIPRVANMPGVQALCSCDGAKESYEERQCRLMNELPGHLTDYDCPLCRNKGYIYVLNETGELVCRKCRCLGVRESYRRLRQSGLAPMEQAYALEKFRPVDELARRMLAHAHAYVKKPRGWFFAGGQSGSGKSHLCAGIALKLLQQGKALRAVLWRDEAARLKELQCSPGYTSELDRLRHAPVLYLDDFLKTQGTDRGARRAPTAGDVNLAYEILEYRYMHPELPTLISSEWHSGEILSLDEALGGRILERARDHLLNIPSKAEYNRRVCPLPEEGGREENT